jgi:hypothetical protein
MSVSTLIGTEAGLRPVIDKPSTVPSLLPSRDARRALQSAPIRAESRRPDGRERRGRRCYTQIIRVEGGVQ